MVGVAHERRAVAAFQDGEQRLVYARSKDEPSAALYLLIDGTARDPMVKNLAKEHLECPMPECHDRRLGAVNRSEHSGRRDGFSHRRGAGRHSPESIFHQQGKALVQSWIMERYPHVTAVMEEATSDRSRRADVMLTWPDGSRAAVEIQYAPLAVDAWLNRHQSYLDQGITPIWLLGHHGAHMKPASATAEDETPGDATLSLLHQQMTRREVSVLWINPIDQTIATPWIQKRLRFTQMDFSMHCEDTSVTVRLGIDALSDCELDPAHGVLTPTSRLLVASEVAYNDAVERQRTEAERVAATLEARRQAQQSEWLGSDLRAKVIAHFGGEVPSVFGDDLASADQIDAAPVMWRCLIYGELILGKPSRTQITREDCYQVLDHHGIAQGPGRQRAVEAFLLHLAQHQVLTVLHHFSSRTIARIEVRNDIRAIREAAARRAERARRAAQLRLQRERSSDALRPSPAPAYARNVDLDPSAPRTHCLTCGGRLDPILGRAGRHFGC